MPEQYKLTHLDRKIDKIESAISEISEAVQTLVAAEVRNIDTASDLKSIRAKLQLVSETVAALPTKEEMHDLTTRTGKAENRVTALETKVTLHRTYGTEEIDSVRKLLYWFIGIAATVLAGVLGKFL